MNKELKIVSSTDFPKEYMGEIPVSFEVVATPIQLFNLEETSEFIKIPTPLHRQDYNSIIHVTRGTARQQVNAEEYTVSEDEILFVKQGSIFSIKEIDEKITGSIILFNEAVFNHMLSKQDLMKLFSMNPVVFLDKTTNEWLTTLIGLLRNEIYSTAPNFDCCYSLLQAALQKLISANKDLVTSIHRNDKVAFAFKELVHTHHLQNKSVAFYADKLAVSVNYLNRCVKQTTGIAPKEWINKVSILHSQLLLQDLTKGISEIAFELNYEDPSYFGRLFKKVTGITPSQYRESALR